MPGSRPLRGCIVLGVPLPRLKYIRQLAEADRLAAAACQPPDITGCAARPAGGDTGSMEDDAPGVGEEADEVFDHELTHMLDARGQELAEQSQILLATGTASIPMPGATLHARLRSPRWWRHGLLELAAEDARSGEITRACSVPVGKSDRSHVALTREITINLAYELTYGPSSTGTEPH